MRYEVGRPGSGRKFTYVQGAPRGNVPTDEAIQRLMAEEMGFIPGESSGQDFQAYEPFTQEEWTNFWNDLAQSYPDLRGVIQGAMTGSQTGMAGAEDATRLANGLQGVGAPVTASADVPVGAPPAPEGIDQLVQPDQIEDVPPIEETPSFNELGVIPSIQVDEPVGQESNQFADLGQVVPAGQMPIEAPDYGVNNFEEPAMPSMQVPEPISSTNDEFADLSGVSPSADMPMFQSPQFAAVMPDLAQALGFDPFAPPDVTTTDSPAGPVIMEQPETGGMSPADVFAAATESDALNSVEPDQPIGQGEPQVEINPDQIPPEDIPLVEPPPIPDVPDDVSAPQSSGGAPVENQPVFNAPPPDTIPTGMNYGNATGVFAASGPFSTPGAAGPQFSSNGVPGWIGQYSGPAGLTKGLGVSASLGAATGGNMPVGFANPVGIDVRAPGETPELWDSPKAFHAADKAGMSLDDFNARNDAFLASQPSAPAGPEFISGWKWQKNTMPGGGSQPSGPRTFGGLDNFYANADNRGRWIPVMSPGSGTNVAMPAGHGLATQNSLFPTKLPQPTGAPGGPPTGLAHGGRVRRPEVMRRMSGKVPGRDTGVDKVHTLLRPGEVVFNTEQLKGITVKNAKHLRPDQITAIQQARRQTAKGAPRGGRQRRQTRAEYYLKMAA